ncbi:MAG: gamma-glutamyltransferase family protein [bacterium]
MPEHVSVGIVAAPHPTAAEAALEIMKAGGNAIDGAVAAAFTLTVVAPASTSPAGYGGSLLVWLPSRGEPIAVDFTSRAPAAAHEAMFDVQEDGHGGFSVAEAANAFGGRSVDVPGIVAGLTLTQGRYGSLPLRTVMQPAIDAANHGFPVDAWTVQKITETLVPNAERYPHIYRLFSLDGRPPRPGETLTNPDLARTLETIAGDGAEAFYSGEIARAIVETVRLADGILTLDDLARYTPVEIAAVSTHYRGHTIYTPPLPTGGLTILQMLRVLEDFDAPKTGHDGDLIHLLVEVSKSCWRERLTRYGDPEGVAVDPQAELSAAKVWALQEDTRAGLRSPRPGAVVAPDPLLTGTAHLCTADRQGNVVSLTTTLGGSFGSLLTVPGLGLVLGHGISRFDPRPGRANSIGPWKRPLHNMSPILAIKNARPALAIGAAGGRTILSTVINSIVRLLDLNEGPHAAVSTPRFHIETAEPVLIEQGGDSLADGLTRRGHRVQLRPRFGSLQGILFSAAPSVMTGIADPRRAGTVLWA